MTEVYLALGSNVGDSGANIAKAVELLSAKLTNLKMAPLYRSKPAGYTEQPDFLNTAASGQTRLEPQELFEFAKQVEKQVGRIERFRWGPREIDIDIIFYGDRVIKNEKLEIPHPRFAERDFVLQPLADLNPDLKDPRSGQTVSQLLAAVGNLTDLQRLNG
ncbi:MAG TPA: 2-amino-4-hydroxy-6-hydroxymethyldihydropteridine diphosphokinase [Candidatus Saccharimonadia bacterium]|nr:2-amino-4-hydroxy-6-hydroxymethyldihydropteridine diphosphokinase [Candidatus Saccharimonadia bacterium]